MLDKGNPEMRIKTVIQEEISGCGIACVAMLAGQSYAEAKRKANQLGIFSEDEKLWSETGHVRRLLKEYGIKASETEIPFSTWSVLPNLALLAIKYHLEGGRPFWHWTVFQRIGDKGIVHDPAAYLETNEWENLEEMSPKWFIEISLAN